MIGAQAHLLLNHLPVILPVVGMALATAGLLTESRDLKKAGLAVLVVAALTAIPAFLTGDGAEAEAKNYPGVTRHHIHEHEAAAKQALIAMEIAGLGGLILLIQLIRGKSSRRPAGAPPLELGPDDARPIPAGQSSSRWQVWGVMILYLGAFVLMARAAHLGGFIRHEEIRPAEATLPMN